MNDIQGFPYQVLDVYIPFLTGGVGINLVGKFKESLGNVRDPFKALFYLQKVSSGGSVVIGLVKEHVGVANNSIKRIIDFMDNAPGKFSHGGIFFKMGALRMKGIGFFL